MTDRELQNIGEDKTLLLVDDDEPFLRRLARAMEKRGFEVETAASVAGGGKAISTARPPAFAVVDLRLEDGTGLDVVEVLREKRPDCRIVVLTGYGAIATAVAAVKAGATDYLSKPADATTLQMRCWPRATSCRRRRKTRCPQTACVGSISSGSMSCVTATCRRPRDV